MKSEMLQVVDVSKADSDSFTLLLLVHTDLQNMQRKPQNKHNAARLFVCTYSASNQHFPMNYVRQSTEKTTQYKYPCEFY